MHILKLIFALYLITNGLSTSWAIKPYMPVHPDPVLEPWRWRSFPELKGQDVRCMVEDKNGHMWFGTKNSVWKYDGVTWQSFGSSDGLDGQPVVALTISNSSNIYAATSNGIYVYNTPTWHRIFPQQNQLPWYFSDLVVTTNEEIWAGSVWGIVYLHHDTQKFYTLKEIAHDIQDLFPTMQYITLPDQIIPAQVTPYGGLGMQRINNTVSWVIAGSPADSAGLKIGDQIINTQGLPSENSTSRTQITLKRGTQTIHPTLFKRAGKGHVKEFEIHDIHPDRDGNMWFTLSTGHVAQLKRPSDQWHIFPANDNLEISRLSHVSQMQDGTLWVISEDRTQGIHQYNGQTWSALKLSDWGGTDVNPSVLQTTDGTIWVGGHEGYLHALRNNTWHIYQTPQHPLPQTRITQLLEAKDGALWIIGQGSDPIRLDYGNTQWTTFEGLNYACQSSDNQLWFLSQTNDVVKFDGKKWICYDTSDGLIDTPTGIFATQRGEIWVVGSHNKTAASSRLWQNEWERQTYPTLSWGIDSRATYEAIDGSIWLGAAVDWFPERGHKGGIIQIASQNQIHHTPPDVLRYTYGIGQMADQSIWIGSYRGLNVLTQNSWTHIDTLETLSSRIDVVYTPPNGELYLGHRNQGVFHFDGTTWTQYDSRHGLADNTIRSILKTHDQTVWVVSARGISRFDGTTWTTPALPQELYTDLRGSLRQSSEGSLWINTASDAWHRRAWPTQQTYRTDQQNFRVVHYVPDMRAPETTITLAAKEVSQPGNTTITWHGIDPWHRTAIPYLLYAWQLDNGTWSPFSHETHHVFQALKSGDHVFRVKARDRGFNIDPTPAEITFTVIPPVYQQPWFIAVATLSIVLIVLQTIRIIRRDQHLQTINDELSQLNTELQATNQNLEDTREQLIIKEKMVSLGNLVAGIAHEMNTPLGALNSSADVMRRCLDRISQIVIDRQAENTIHEDANYQRAMKLLENNAQITVTVSERISQIVNSLRNFARLDEAEFQHVNIHEGIESILLLRKSDLQDKIKITKSYGKLPPVACYPSELNQVFMNVLSNAIEAITDTGEIHIQTTTQHTNAHITITDTGCGIPQEYHDQIFNPGFTTKGVGVGVGLGLAIAYRIIQKHNGTITIASEEEQGTTCTIEIPIEKD